MQEIFPYIRYIHPDYIDEIYDTFIHDTIDHPDWSIRLNPFGGTITLDELRSFIGKSHLVPELSSYRGNYEEVAVDYQETLQDNSSFDQPVDAMLQQEQMGYKGGSYQMTSDTPLHLAASGDMGYDFVGYAEIYNADATYYMLYVTDLTGYDPAQPFQQLVSYEDLLDDLTASC